MSTPIRHITVLKGGPSAEREVSLKSGAAVAEALRGEGFDVTELDIHGPDFELPQGTDLAFVILHGTFGEDGQIQEILSAKEIPYTGGDASSSRLAFDKVASKKVFIEKGISTPPSQIVATVEELTLEPPLFIKPPCQGSSVGTHGVATREELVPALEDALMYGDQALVETWIKGREFTVGIFDGEALPIVEVRPKEGFYDYKNKYTAGMTEYICPAELDEAVREQMQAIAVQAHRALGCGVYSRVDFLLDADNTPYVLEINTIPGMTATSLLPKSAAAKGISFGQLCRQIAERTHAAFHATN